MFDFLKPYSVPIGIIFFALFIIFIHNPNPIVEMRDCGIQEQENGLYTIMCF